MQYFPDNSVTRFKTRLENPISLSGNWEVGLFEVQYVRSWYTIGSKEGWFRYDRFDNDTHEVDSLYVRDLHGPGGPRAGPGRARPGRAGPGYKK